MFYNLIVNTQDTADTTGFRTESAYYSSLQAFMDVWRIDNSELNQIAETTIDGSTMVVKIVQPRLHMIWLLTVKVGQ